MTDEQIGQWFSTHLVKLSHADSHLGKITILEWRTPGSSVYAIVYVVLNGTLMVYGDLGEAVYLWYGEISLTFLSGLNIDYFASKCEASEYGRGGKEWSEGHAREVLLRNVRDTLGPNVTLEAAFPDVDTWEIEEALAHQHAWCQFISSNPVMSNGEKLGMELCDCADAGMVPALRIRAHLIGLKQAVRQIGGI